MIRQVKNIYWRLYNLGFKETWLWLNSHYTTWSREKRRRIDTSGRLSTKAKAIDDCNGYEPIQYECLDRIFECIEIKKNDVLVDFGSGKGRVLIEASLHPFKRIEGVEFNLQLVQQAEENIDSFNRVLLNNIIFVHHCDARDYIIPQDVTHIFIWNSFVGDVLKSVVNRITSLSSATEKKINVVLALPSGENDSLELFNSFDAPRKIETDFWTGVDLYWFRTDYRSNEVATNPT